MSESHGPSQADLGTLSPKDELNSIEDQMREIDAANSGMDTDESKRGENEEKYNKLEARRKELLELQKKEQEKVDLKQLKDQLENVEQEMREIDESNSGLDLYNGERSKNEQRYKELEDKKNDLVAKVKTAEADEKEAQRLEGLKKELEDTENQLRQIDQDNSGVDVDENVRRNNEERYNQLQERKNSLVREIKATGKTDSQFGLGDKFSIDGEEWMIGGVNPDGTFLMWPMINTPEDRSRTLSREDLTELAKPKEDQSGQVEGGEEHNDVGEPPAGELRVPETEEDLNETKAETKEEQRTPKYKLEDEFPSLDGDDRTWKIAKVDDIDGVHTYTLWPNVGDGVKVKTTEELDNASGADKEEKPEKGGDKEPTDGTKRETEYKEGDVVNLVNDEGEPEEWVVDKKNSDGTHNLRREKEDGTTETKNDVSEEMLEAEKESTEVVNAEERLIAEEQKHLEELEKKSPLVKKLLRGMSRYYRKSLLLRASVGAVSTAMTMVPGLNVLNGIGHAAKVVIGALGGGMFTEAMTSGALKALTNGKLKGVRENGVINQQKLEQLSKDDILEAYGALREIASEKGLKIDAKLFKLDQEHFAEIDRKNKEKMEARKNNLLGKFDKLKASFNKLPRWKKVVASVGIPLALGAGTVLGVGALGGTAAVASGAALGVRSAAVLGMGLLSGQKQIDARAFEQSDMVEALRHELVKRGMTEDDFNRINKVEKVNKYTKKGAGVAGMAAGAAIAMLLGGPAHASENGAADHASTGAGSLEPDGDAAGIVPPDGTGVDSGSTPDSFGGHPPIDYGDGGGGGITPPGGVGAFGGSPEPFGGHPPVDYGGSGGGITPPTGPGILGDLPGQESGGFGGPHDSYTTVYHEGPSDHVIPRGHIDINHMRTEEISPNTVTVDEVPPTSHEPGSFTTTFDGGSPEPALDHGGVDASHAPGGEISTGTTAENLDNLNGSDNFVHEVVLADGVDNFKEAISAPGGGERLVDRMIEGLSGKGQLNGVEQSQIDQLKEEWLAKMRIDGLLDKNNSISQAAQDRFIAEYNPYVESHKILDHIDKIGDGETSYVDTWNNLNTPGGTAIDTEATSTTVSSGTESVVNEGVHNIDAERELAGGVWKEVMAQDGKGDQFVDKMVDSLRSNDQLPDGITELQIETLKDEISNKLRVEGIFNQSGGVEDFDKFNATDPYELTRETFNHMNSGAESYADQLSHLDTLPGAEGAHHAAETGSNNSADASASTPEATPQPNPVDSASTSAAQAPTGQSSGTNFFGQPFENAPAPAHPAEIPGITDALVDPNKYSFEAATPINADQLQNILNPNNGYLSEEVSETFQRLLKEGTLKPNDFRVADVPGGLDQIKVDLSRVPDSAIPNHADYIGHQLLKDYSGVSSEPRGFIDRLFGGFRRPDNAPSGDTVTGATPEPGPTVPPASTPPASPDAQPSPTIPNTPGDGNIISGGTPMPPETPTNQAQ